MSAEKTGKNIGKPKNPQEAVESVAEPAPAPKKPLSWKEKLALLPEGEAKALRAKAAEASRRSKMKKKGITPEKAAVERLTAKLEKINEEQTALNIRRQETEEQLEAAQAALAAAEKQGEHNDGAV